MGYEKMDTITSCFVKAISEHVRTVGKIADQNVHNAILSFNPSGTKKSIDKTLSMLTRKQGLSVLLICPNDHVNIGNQIECKFCKMKLIESCRGKGCVNGICPHTRCHYVDGCIRIENRPVHELFTDLFMLEDESGCGFLTRMEHAEAVFFNIINGIHSGYSSINNYFLLTSLEENHIANYLKCSIPSTMKKRFDRDIKLNLPPYFSRTLLIC